MMDTPKDTELESRKENWEDPSVASLVVDCEPRVISKRLNARFANGLKLERGESLPEIDVAYETFGALNEKKDNAILVIHALTGDSHCSGYYSDDPKEKPGWWNQLIGPGKGIDTNRYFVVCSNILGGCSGTTGPTSINPKTGRRYNADFPEITFGDMVEVQRMLVDYLGIDKLLAVVGGSMGGMMVLEWAKRYPERVHSIVPVATAPCMGPQGIGFSYIQCQCIKLDPKWNGGNYDPEDPPAHGLAMARQIAHITYLSQQSMRKKFGRRRQVSNNQLTDIFEVESYLNYQGNKFVDRFDANSYITITEALEDYNLAAEAESLDEAVSGFQCKSLFLSFRTDWLFPTREAKELVEALRRQNKSVEFCEIDSPGGHDAFLIDYPKYENLVARFLERIYDNYNN